MGAKPGGMGAALGGSGKDPSSALAKAAGGKLDGGGKSGIGGLLSDKKKMAGIADGLGMLSQQMQPQAAPPPMTPMEMGGGASMANGDPSALAALAARRPDIFSRIGRFSGGGY